MRRPTSDTLSQVSLRFPKLALVPPTRTQRHSVKHKQSTQTSFAYCKRQCYTSIFLQRVKNKKKAQPNFLFSCASSTERRKLAFSRQRIKNSQFYVGLTVPNGTIQPPGRVEVSTRPLVSHSGGPRTSTLVQYSGGRYGSLVCCPGWA